MESNDKLEQMLMRMYDQETLHDDRIDTKDIIDEEWTKFEAKHFQTSSNALRFTLMKVAAAIVGILMLGGISYATIHYMTGSTPTSQQQETSADANIQRSTVNAQPDEQQHFVYENVELKDILRELATYYHFEIVYKNEKAKHVRLYFTWDMKATLDELIETFNKFERIHITREDQKLIVE